MGTWSSLGPSLERLPEAGRLDAHARPSRQRIRVYADLASAATALGCLEEIRRLPAQPASEPATPLGINRVQRGMWSCR